MTYLGPPPNRAEHRNMACWKVLMHLHIHLSGCHQCTRGKVSTYSFLKKMNTAGQMQPQRYQLVCNLSFLVLLFFKASFPLGRCALCWGSWLHQHSMDWILIFSFHSLLAEDFWTVHKTVPLYMAGLLAQVGMEIKEEEEIRWKEREVCPSLVSALPNSFALEFRVSHVSTRWPWVLEPKCLYILGGWKNGLIEVDKPTTGQICSIPKEETSIPLNLLPGNVGKCWAENQRLKIFCSLCLSGTSEKQTPWRKGSLFCKVTENPSEDWPWELDCLSSKSQIKRSHIWFHFSCEIISHWPSRSFPEYINTEDTHMVVIKQYCAKLNWLLYGEMEKNGKYFKHMSFSSLGLEAITHEDSYFICWSVDHSRRDIGLG